MRMIDSVNWWRLSFLLALAQFQLGQCIQVAPDPKTSNSTQSPQTEEPPSVAAGNTTLTGDSELSASERQRRLIPYMAFYLPRDFPINQQYAIQGAKGVFAINGKHSKPISVQGSHTPANGQFPVPQSYMNLRAPPQSIQGSNGELLFAPAPQQQHYLQSAGDIYQQLAYTAAGPPQPPPPAIMQHAQPAAPPLSQSLINTKGTNMPVLRLLPPGPPPGPTVAPIIKHRHKTVQHFPPTKPPTLQQLPYEHLQSQLLEPQRHKTHHHQQLQHQHQHQPQQQPIFVSQPQQQQQQQLAPAALSLRQQTRPKQSKVNLTPFTPSNTLPGHFIPIIYTPVSGNGNENHNNNNHVGNTLNYDYGNPTVVLVDDLSPPIEATSLQQQQQEQIQQQLRPSISQHPHNEYTLVAPVEIGQQQLQQQQQQHQHERQQLQQQQEIQQQQQQQRHHYEQQQLQQQYITATNAPSTAVLLSSQQAELPTGSAASASLNPQSTTSSPASQYIDYIVEDPKQSLDDEQHNPTAPPTAIATGGNSQDYYEPTNRQIYKQKPTLRLKPIYKSNNYATKRPNAVTLQPPPAPQPQLLPPSPPAHSAADKPQYIYADSNFGEKMSTTAVKLRPSYKYSGGIDSRLAPPAQPPPSPPQAAPPATSHQFQENQPENLPQYYNPPVPVAAKTTSPIAAADPNQLPDIRSSSLAEILHKLQESNHLPKTLTPENIDNSIKTLVTILENLKQTQTIVQNPPQHHDRPSASPDYDYNTGSEEVNGGGAPDLSSVLSPIGPNKHPGPSTGRAGIDYPNYADIPQTNFNCGQQRYKGFFGDPETNCQVWHYCDLNGGKASFLCPNGTIFSQIALTCDWWFNVKCSTTAQLYVLNERLYKYILPFSPKFPEDYSGPLVDKYLAMKFQEMEEKMRIEKEKAAEKAANDAAVAPTTYTQPNNEIADIDDSAVDEENDNNAPVTAVVDTEVTTVTDTRTLTRTNSGRGNGRGHNKHGAINAHVSEQSSQRNLLIDDEVDDISKRGGVDTFESSTIPTLSAASVVKQDNIHIVSMEPIVVSSTEIPTYDDADETNTYNVRNVDEATSSTLTTENALRALQETTQSDMQLLQEENQAEIVVSPKPVRQAATTNIDVEKVEVIEIKSEGANGQMGPKMYYGAESEKGTR